MILYWWIRTDDFQKFCGLGLDRIRNRLVLKNFAVRSSLVSGSWLAVSLRNPCTDQARKPVKTSQDPRDSKDSNENDTNLPFHLTFVKKILICAFAELKFQQNPK